MEQCGLGVLELGRDVAGEAEVRILVDRAGDEAWDVGGSTEDVGEGVGERGCGLDGGEVDLAYIVADIYRVGFLRASTSHDNLRVVETKCSLCLVDGNLAGDLGDILVEGTANVVIIAENESLLDVEADGYDVTGISSCELVRLLRLELVLEQELLVIYADC